MITLVGWTEYDPSGQIGPSIELDIDVHSDEEIAGVKKIADLMVRDGLFVSTMMFDEDDNEIYDAK